MQATQASGVPDRYPVTCPHCSAKAGVPVAVMTVVNEPKALRLDFRCGQCYHRWLEQFESAAATPREADTTSL